MRKKFNKRLLINLVVVLIIGIFSGYFIGNFYVSNYMGGVTADLLPSEEELRDSIADVLKRTKGKSVEQISAIDNYVLAEYYLSNNHDTAKKIVKGTVTAAGVTQTLLATRIKSGNNYFGEEISCKQGSIGVNYAQRFYYTAGVDKVPVHNGSNITSTSASWKSSPDVEHTMESFRAVMGISPTYFQNYIVSSKTVIDGVFVKKTDAGNYQFKLELDVTNSVKNYMYKIKETSKSDEFPIFEYCTMIFEIDKDWKLISIKYNEKYKVKIAVIGRVDTVGDLTETFEYDGNYEIPKC